MNLRPLCPSCLEVDCVCHLKPEDDGVWRGRRLVIEYRDLGTGEWEEWSVDERVNGDGREDALYHVRNDRAFDGAIPFRVRDADTGETLEEMNR